MTKNELIHQACTKIGMDDKNPDIYNDALVALDEGIREYSSTGCLQVFQSCIDVHLNEGETTIGCPIPKKGINLHFDEELPSLVGYDPDDNNMGWVMGADYFIIGDVLYGIAYNAGEYYWAEIVDDRSMLLKNPDIWVTDMGSVSDIIVGDEVYKQVGLRQYLLDNDKCYVVNTNLGKFIKITCKECDAKLIYNTAINVNEIETIDLPFLYTSLLVYHIAHALDMVAEEKAEMKAKLDSIINTIQSNNADTSILNCLRF